MTLEIFMPFYGDPIHFREAVESILSQSDPEWTLTVVDDVYPDTAPGRWLVELNDARISYIRNGKNLGPSANYNKCVELARAEYIILMGCDDVMLPGFIARVKELVQKFPAADIIQPGVAVIDENSKPCNPLPDKIKKLIAPKSNFPCELKGEVLEKSLLIGNWTYFPSLAWRRTRLSDLTFREDLNVVQDLMMLLRITESGGVLLKDSEVVFHYRRHSSSVSGKQGANGSKFLQEYQLFQETAKRTKDLHWEARADSLRFICYLELMHYPHSFLDGPQVPLRVNNYSFGTCSNRKLQEGRPALALAVLFEASSSRIEARHVNDNSDGWPYQQ